jgi:DNA-binding PadR family transcriptional regulator
VSWPALVWARDQTDVRGASYAVLWVLAAAADDAGVAWPSWRTLARWAHVSTGSLGPALTELECAGLVEVTRGHGRSSNRYRLSGAVAESLEGCGQPASDAVAESHNDAVAESQDFRSDAIWRANGAAAATDYPETQIKTFAGARAHAREADELPRATADERARVAAEVAALRDGLGLRARRDVTR